MRMLKPASSSGAFATPTLTTTHTTTTTALSNTTTTTTATTTATPNAQPLLPFQKVSRTQRPTSSWEILYSSQQQHTAEQQQQHTAEQSQSQSQSSWDEIQYRGTYESDDSDTGDRDRGLIGNDNDSGDDEYDHYEDEDEDEYDDNENWGDAANGEEDEHYKEDVLPPQPSQLPPQPPQPQPLAPPPTAGQSAKENRLLPGVVRPMPSLLEKLALPSSSTAVALNRLVDTTGSSKSRAAAAVRENTFLLDIAKKRKSILGDNRSLGVGDNHSHNHNVVTSIAGNAVEAQEEVGIHAKPSQARPREFPPPSGRCCCSCSTSHCYWIFRWIGI